MTSYRSAAEHLRDELERVDQLVRAAAVEWLDAIGATKERRLWGMPYVAGAEVESYLAAPFTREGFAPATCEEATVCRRRADAHAARIAARMAATGPGVRLPLRDLADRFDLTRAETDVVLLCTLPEIDARYRRLYGFLHDDVTRIQPSVEFLLRVLAVRDPAGARSLLGPAAPLVAHTLIVFSAGSVALPLATRSVQLEDRVLGHVVGDATPDPRIAGFTSRIEGRSPWRDDLAERSDGLALQALVALWAERRRAGRALLVLLQGAEGTGRTCAARAVCAATGTPILRVDAGRLMSAACDERLAIDLCIREAQLCGAALLWAVDHLSGEAGSRARRYLQERAPGYAGLSFVVSRESVEIDRTREEPLHRVALRPPGVATRKRIWRALLDEPSDPALATESSSRQLDERVAGALAASFRFTFGQIEAAVREARSRAALCLLTRPSPDDLFAAARRQAGHRLVGLARRVEPTRRLTLDDLILPRSSKRQVRELGERMLHHRVVLERSERRGRATYRKGLVALFAGPSGTGKTMAAELLAQERQIDLYKVDLSALVSKYVGETEKNLDRVLRDAEAADALLLFDEGESLFGQRGRIQQGQDRWANLEVNFLLQRIEDHSGVVVIATNLKHHIDEAFLRRIHVVVDFPLPDEDCRHDIWGRHLEVEEAALDAVALREIAARFTLSGGAIRNVVLDAACRAIARGAAAIEARDLVSCVAREYQKAGRPLSVAEFGAQFFAWVRADLLEAEETRNAAFATPSAGRAA